MNRRAARSPAILAVLVPLAACAPRGPDVLADFRDGVNHPYALAQTQDHVYWVERGGAGAVRRTAKTGGPVETLATGAAPYAYFCAVDGAHLYWTEFDTGRLRRVPRAGGAVETWADGLGNPGQVAVHGGFVYWVEYAGNAVRRRAVAGGVVETLAADLEGPQGLAVDDEAVFWTEFSDPPRLKRLDRRTGAITVLARTRPECWLVPSGGFLYWTETRGSVRRIPRAGGEVVDLAKIPPSGAYAAANATHLYWAEEHGGVMRRLSFSDGAVETVLTGLRHPALMTADERGVYWADPEAHRIYRLPLPLPEGRGRRRSPRTAPPGP